MARLMIFLAFFCIFAQGAKTEPSGKLEISAKEFMADDAKKYSEFKGDVKLKRGEDSLNCNTLRIYLNEKRKPISYEAQGNVSFLIAIEQSKYEGQANTLIYDISSQIYELKGDAQVKDLTRPKELNAQSIFMDKKKGSVYVKGGKAPIKLVIDLE